MSDRPKTRLNYTPEDLERAVQHVTRGMSLRKAANATHVPVTTIRDHSRGKYKNINTKIGALFALTNQEEEALSNYVIYMGDRGFPLTRKVIKKLTTDIAKASGRPPRINIEHGPSNKWVRDYLKRHRNLSLRKPHPLEGDRSLVSQQQIDGFYNILQETLTKLDIKDDHTRIFNFDETGFSGKEHAREKIVLKKGTKHPYQPIASVGGHITLQLAVSAAGKVIAPLVIYSKNLPKSDFTEGMPDEWKFAHSDSGYINTDIFVSWFEDCFVKQCGRARPVLVVMDNLSSHLTKAVIDIAQREHIELLCLPAHTTHLLQPLDVGYYHLLKENVASLSTALGYTGMKTIPRHKFPKLLHLAINKIAASTVTASFSCVGICPFDSSKVKVSSDIDPVKENSTGAQYDDELACEKCGLISKENHLVKLGLIPASLKQILTVPEKNVPKTPSKRVKYDSARVITTVQPVPVASTSTSETVTSQARKCRPLKKCDKRKQKKVAKKSVVISPPTPLPELLGDSQVLCEVCMTGSNALTWIGCDSCDRWLHYECIESYDERLAIDLSLVTGAQWWCNTCRNVEE